MWFDKFPIKIGYGPYLVMHVLDCIFDVSKRQGEGVISEGRPGGTICPLKP